MTTDKEKLQRRIQDIAIEVRDLTVPDDLFRCRMFLDVYEAPGSFVTAVSELYSDPNASMLHKEIAGYAMQRLSIGQLVSLVARVADLTIERKVSPLLLERLAFPPMNWGVQLCIDHSMPDVHALLERLATMVELRSEIRGYIRDRVLTGLAKNDVLELREAGQLR